MRENIVPPKTKNREKVLWGIIGWAEIIVCSAGLMIGFVFGFLLQKIFFSAIPAFGIVVIFLFAFIGFALGAGLSFIKRKGLPIYRYWQYKKKIETRKNILLK